MENSTKILITGVLAVGIYSLINKTNNQPINLIQNPGFEIVGPEWLITQSGINAQITTEQTIYGNSLAINYTSNDGTEVASVSQSVPIIGNNLYKLGGKIRINNVVAIIPNGSSIYLRWLDINKVFISNGKIMNAIIGSIDWLNYEGVITAPPNAAFAQVICTLSKSNGKTWFDDIYLYKQ